MNPRRLKIIVFGLSLSSSWGNGHATTYRALLRALAKRGHAIHFFERDQKWYRDHRDLTDPPYTRLTFYENVIELQSEFEAEIRTADLVILGSYVPEGVLLGEWLFEIAKGLVCFYDIDTPVTLEKLRKGDCEYVAPHLIPRFDVYLSFTGGPTLKFIEADLGSPCARTLYCSVDPDLYYTLPEQTKTWRLGYLGTFSQDRQAMLEELLLKPAAKLRSQQFAIAGPNYPDSASWPSNIDYVPHLAPSEHLAFYNSQEFTLNVTRADMVKAGYSPSVRLFEAAACGVPIVSDYWPGIETFFEPDQDIFVVESDDDCVAILDAMPEERRATVGRSGYRRVLNEHTAKHRALELEKYLAERANAARLS